MMSEPAYDDEVVAALGVDPLSPTADVEVYLVGQDVRTAVIESALADFVAWLDEGLRPLRQLLEQRGRVPGAP